MFGLRALLGSIVVGGLTLASAAPSVGAATIGVNFNGGAGNTTTENGPTVTGSAGAVPALNWNNVPGHTGSGIQLVDNLNANAATFSFNVPNVYGATPAGPGTSGGAGDTALMTGQLDNFGNGGTFATVTGLSTGFRSGGYQVLVYQNADSAGSWGFTITDSDGHTDTRYGRQLGGNGTNYPLAGGTNGYVSSVSTDPAGPATSANYVILSGFTGTNFTLTGIAGTSNDGRPRPNGFEIVAVPEPAALGLIGLSAVGLLARRRRAVSAA